MNYTSSSDNKDSPTASFQRLCDVMLDGTSNLTKKNVEDFRVILHIIMHECSKANIETGKAWVFEHCQTPVHASVILEYILSLSSFRKSQEERIHMVYLVNDVLFHTARKQLTWMRDALLPLLVPLLKLAYDVAESSEYKDKVIKVISFWGDQGIFEPNTINHIKQSVSDPYYKPNQQQHSTVSPQIAYSHPQQYPSIPKQSPTYPQRTPFPQPVYQQPQVPPQGRYRPLPAFQQPEHHQPSPAQPQTQRPPMPPPISRFSQKPYFELPAGLMIIAKTEDYKPINPALIKLPFPPPPLSQELSLAVEDFYKELDIDVDSILGDKSESNIDAQGWEKGYLDPYFESVAQRKTDRLLQESKGEEHYSKRGHSPSRNRSKSRSRSRNHSRSPARRSRRHSYSRSRSPSPRRRSPRGRSPRRSPPPSHHRRSSPVRARSPPRRSRFRDPTPPRRISPPPSSYRQRRRSRSPPPATFGGGAPENRYLGLGSASDDFDSFRRNKSQAYNRRETHQPIACYKCNNVGHLARECHSL